MKHFEITITTTHTLRAIVRAESPEMIRKIWADDDGIGSVIEAYQHKVSSEITEISECVEIPDGFRRVDEKEQLSREHDRADPE